MKQNDEIFSRQVAIWGKARQQILAQSAILIAGVGGLGCIVAEILARAGIGTLILLDHKSVDLPDLHRQALYSLEDLGKAKIQVAARKLTSFNSLTNVIPLSCAIGAPHWDQSLDAYHIHGIVDCLDNYPSRFALNHYLKPDQFLVHGGVQEDYGQLTTIKKGKTPELRDIFYGSAAPSRGPLPVCPHIVFCLGGLMAWEVQKNLWQEPELLNQLLVVELSDLSFSKIQLAPPPRKDN